jgi:hypothetical protein
VICKFVTSLLLFYYYKLELLCLRDEQAVYKQRSVHVKARSYITLGVFLKDGIRKRNGKNCSDWLNFYLKYYALKHTIQYKGQ